ncbi:hypothetical protein G7Y89_g2913 [Cudoniella acicularis]|uniref:Ubiquitin-protein ligase E3A N-terminal zinc-binding domain-containing protein n=1 Tax=Cudoniella acicularis TaxID=354080 RepID=A0A8H4RT80_9HELO|nr:hypothetical protein G7Y89_g2913 [Cudoniella acicularis]
MTRDIQGLRDGHDLASEDEMYVALWATAPFPRLPEDAPDQMRDFVVDIDDPKRIYAIHRAARRHQFQILVERQAELDTDTSPGTCNTTTCFSCRRRLAGGAPVRRYNATSARTLAIYMASQDNPEQGLCNHPSADRPVPPKARSLTLRTTHVDREEPSSSGAKISTRERKKRHGSTTPNNETPSSSRSQIHKDQRRKSEKPEAGAPVDLLSAIEEPHVTDHRSFVQNVFGTVAFKMLEWLTPKSLEALSRPEDQVSKSPNHKPNTPSISSTTDLPTPTSTESGLEEKPSDVKLETGSNNDPVPKKSPTETKNDTKQKLTPTSFTSEPKPQTTQEPKPIANSVTSRASKVHGRRKSEPTEPQCPKGILNLHSRTSETSPEG